ncbi:cobalt transport protein [Eubacterium brachy ATCC 33089]|jgi:hypothetical protein|nr:cobalt transport protein [Eubacterium brachy ATCC 33089]
MIRDITLGQYYQAESIIHRLDPRVKMIGTLIYIITLFIFNTFLGFAFAALCLFGIVRTSKVPFKFIVKGLKPIFFIIIFTFVLNMFMIRGEVLVKFWIFEITKEGLREAMIMAIRLILLILGSSMLTLATKPINLTDGIERLLSPFKKIGFPAHEIAMMTTIALRFIPTLLEETDKIMKAQQARGADFETGNILHRAKQMIPILVPLFISAFRIAQDMAMAMEARCYRGGENRTRMKEMKYEKRDGIAAVAIVLFLCSGIVVRIFS